MRLDDFNFDLPEHLIAKYPLSKRDASRLLVADKSRESIKHCNFSQITEFLKEGDILVRNNSKVMPARFFVYTEHGTKIEILLLKKTADNLWSAMAKPAKRLKDGKAYKLANGLEVLVHKTENDLQIEFADEETFLAVLDAAQMPIPPYMKREAEDLDKERYQTVYASDSESGSSIAAPTAGLHFTDEVNQSLLEKGVEILDTTLHVGLGTFAPIKVDNVTEHRMHAEFYEIEEEVWRKILNRGSRRVIAVGSTSCRVLESVARTGSLTGSTDIYIYPGFEFQVVDAMITNFHLPKSSLMLLVSALMGQDFIRQIYQEAIDQEYRFYSYGDCSLFIA